MRCRLLHPAGGVDRPIVGDRLIPDSCIAGVNDLTVGFASSLLDACGAYWLGDPRGARRSRLLAAAETARVCRCRQAAALPYRDNPGMPAADRRDVITADELLARARAELVRLTPPEAHAAARAGAAIIDIRPAEQRDRDGEVPGAHVIPRNVLEWRLDPRSGHRDPDVARADRQVIVVCDEGYQSSLAAATLRRFGLDATDVVGGVRAWRAAGLPLSRGAGG